MTQVTLDQEDPAKRVIKVLKKYPEGVSRIVIMREADVTPAQLMGALSSIRKTVNIEDVEHGEEYLVKANFPHPDTSSEPLVANQTEQEPLKKEASIIESPKLTIAEQACADILRILNANPDGLMGKEIIEKTGLTAQQFYNAVSELRKTNNLVSTPVGNKARYSISSGDFQEKSNSSTPAANSVRPESEAISDKTLPNIQLQATNYGERVSDPIIAQDKTVENSPNLATSYIESDPIANFSCSLSWFNEDTKIAIENIDDPHLVVAVLDYIGGAA